MPLFLACGMLQRINRRPPAEANYERSKPRDPFAFGRSLEIIRFIATKRHSRELSVQRATQTVGATQLIMLQQRPGAPGRTLATALAHALENDANAQIQWRSKPEC